MITISKLNVFVFVLLVIFSVSAVSAAENMTEKIQAQLCLNESDFIMAEMSSMGFNILRINDTLNEGKLVFNSQKLYQDKRIPHNFSKVFLYCNEINAIKESALIASDEFAALMKFYNESITAGMNTSSIDVVLESIRAEVASERYENVKELVDKAYEEITTVRASYTATAIIYKNTLGFFKRVFIDHWKGLSLTAAALIILFLIYRVQITLHILRRKIEKLKIRKETIRGLIMKTQKNYFQDGKIPEGEYNVKTKKFAELILDIDRQIPLLQEDIARLEKYTQWKRKK